MEVAAAFLLLIVLVVVAVAGAVVWAIASRLRRRQLDPEGDMVEGREAEHSSERRPEHVRVRPDQQTHFVPDR